MTSVCKHMWQLFWSPYKSRHVVHPGCICVLTVETEHFPFLQFWVSWISPQGVSVRQVTFHIPSRRQVCSLTFSASRSSRWLHTSTYKWLLVGQGLSVLPATSSAVSPAAHRNFEGLFMKPLGPLTKSSIVTPFPSSGDKQEPFLPPSSRDKDVDFLGSPYSVQHIWQFCPWVRNVSQANWQVLRVTSKCVSVYKLPACFTV